MANMLDYLRWRGDLSFEADPLNDIDALLLAELSYVSFGDCLAAGEARTVGEAVHMLLKADPEGTLIHQTSYLWEGNRELLALLQRSARFSGLRLLNYTSIMSENVQQQFGAMAFALPGGDALVAFRGTDDSLVGWKEDLNLSFDSPVPSQTQAAAYLMRAAEAVSGSITVCGHSKGGNLAVYAAACVPAEIQERLAGVVSFDGPGQDERVAASAGYARIRPQLRLYIPHFSVVGMLLEQEKRYTVVDSDEKGILQHSAFSWQVEGKRFVEKTELSAESLEIKRILRAWLKKLSAEDRRVFSDAVYEVLASSQEKTLADIGEHWQKSAQAVLHALRNLSGEQRDVLQRALGGLFALALDGILPPWAREKKEEPTDAE